MPTDSAYCCPAAREAACQNGTFWTLPNPMLYCKGPLGELFSDRVKLADLTALLRDHAPAWAPCHAMKGTQLRALLEAQGVRVLTTANILQLDPADLRRALTERE